MFGKKELVGIDIGTVKTKIVYLEKYRGKYRVKKFASLDTPVGTVINGLIIQADVLGEELGKVVEEYKLKGKSTISAVAGSQVYIKNMIMPAMKLTDLKKAAYYQAISFLPIPVEETVIDIFPIRNFTLGGKAKTEVFFVAVKRYYVEELERSIEIAGLNLEIVDLKPLAIHRVMTQSQAFKIKGILNIADTYAGFSIFDEANLLFYSPINLGLCDFSQKGWETSNQFKEAITTEINRSLEYYNFTYQNYPEVIFLFCDKSLYPPIAEYLSENTSLPIQAGKLNENIIVFPREKSPDAFPYEYLIALGLAVRGGI